MLVEYHSNNSGGRWWLGDKDWIALEKAGWRVIWADESFVYKGGDHAIDKKGIPKTKKVKKPDMGSKDKNGRWRYLGSLSRGYAYKHFDSPQAAMREFEAITGQTVSDEGCNCCGPPHTFTWGKGESRGYARGDGCLEYLYENAPKTLREAAELLGRRK